MQTPIYILDKTHELHAGTLDQTFSIHGFQLFHNHFCQCIPTPSHLLSSKHHRLIDERSVLCTINIALYRHAFATVKPDHFWLIHSPHLSQCLAGSMLWRYNFIAPAATISSAVAPYFSASIPATSFISNTPRYVYFLSYVYFSPPTTYNRTLHIAILTGKKGQTKNRQNSSTIKP